MPVPQISQELQASFRKAFDAARKLRHEYVTLEHLLLALTRGEHTREVLSEVGADVTRLQERLASFLKERLEQLPEEVEVAPRHTLAVERVLERAAMQALSAEQDILDGRDVLMALLHEDKSHALFILRQEGGARPDLLAASPRRAPAVAAPREGAQPGRPAEAREEEGPSSFPLEAFTTDLVQQAREGRIDPLIGREMELERTIHVLCRRRKNNPGYVGEPGVGKTAIAEGLALRIHEGAVPEALQGASVYSLDLGALLGGTKFRGQFEERLKAVLKALREKKDAILFIDEIHTIVAAGTTSGGSMDAANLLKPALASGELRCIGSTTYQEYKSSFEKDRALSRRFQRIDVGEPSVEDTLRILEGLRSRYEAHHRVRYTPEALRAAAELSARHINDRFLPDKAIDVLDETGTAERLKPASERTGTVTVADVEAIVSKMARIPAKSVSAQELMRLQGLEKELQSVIFGQDEAIRALANAIKLARSGLRAQTKPIGSFLFSGPTGVGKTELARQLAAALGVEFLRFDMSEYSEKHTASRLIGAPPGYIGFEQGGLLTEAVLKHPHAVLVLDEIEKAHSDLFNILLQVMDHATLTDSNGRKADFRNIILILTTNAGAHEVTRSQSLGFGAKPPAVDTSRVQKAIERTFTPEFRNRLDGWILFGDLSPESILKVVDKEVGLLRKMLTEKQVTLELTEAARQWLARYGFEPAFGARPMARLVDTSLKTPLAEALLFGELRNGGTARFDVKGDALKLHIVASA